MSSIAHYIIENTIRQYTKSVLGWDGDASKEEALQETANIISRHSGYKTLYLEIKDKCLNILVDEKDPNTLRVFKTQLFIVDLETGREIYGKWRRYLYPETLAELKKFC